MADGEAKEAVADEADLVARGLPVDTTDEMARMGTMVCPALRAAAGSSP